VFPDLVVLCAPYMQAHGQQSAGASTSTAPSGPVQSQRGAQGKRASVRATDYFLRPRKTDPEQSPHQEVLLIWQHSGSFGFGVQCVLWHSLLAAPACAVLSPECTELLMLANAAGGACWI
jgi:hypothetical protein